MLKVLEGIVKWVGAVTPITTAIGFIYGLFRDPVYIATALGAVTLALIGFSAEVWLRRQEVQTNLQLPGGTRTRREHAYSRRSRCGVSVVAALLAIGTAWYAAEHFDGFFDLAETYNGEWVGGGKKAILLNTGQEYSYARLMKPEDDPTELGTDACAVKFDLWKKDLVQWVRVDAIRVIVHDYKPNPERIAVTMSYGALVETNALLAEIEPRIGPYSNGTSRIPNTLLPAAFGRRCGALSGADSSSAGVCGRGVRCGWGGR